MTTETWFDGSYPPSLYPTPVVPLTGVTAGTPGAFQPPDGTVPTSLAELRADPVVGNTGSNHPGAAWAEGQYVVLDNVSQTHAYWDGTGWQSGNTPAPAPLARTARTEGDGA
jgi:hypothetical protein